MENYVLIVAIYGLNLLFKTKFSEDLEDPRKTWNFSLYALDQKFMLIQRNFPCPEKFLVAPLKWKLSVAFPLHNFSWQTCKIKFLPCKNQDTYSRALVWLMETCQKLKVFRIKFCLFFFYLKINPFQTLATTSRLNYTFVWYTQKPIRSFISFFSFVHTQ